MLLNITGKGGCIKEVLKGGKRKLSYVKRIVAIILWAGATPLTQKMKGGGSG